MTKDEYWKDHNIYDLCMNFTNDFDIWWDINKLDWFDININKILCKYLPDKFDIWWNPYRCTLGEIIHLVNYMLHKISTWYFTSILNLNDLKKFICNMEWNYD